MMTDALLQVAHAPLTAIALTLAAFVFALWLYRRTGWLVLQPWVTPSLFYQFLSSDEEWGTDAPAHTGMDSYTFCKALGPVEGNIQMRRHWEAWVREELSRERWVVAAVASMSK